MSEISYPNDDSLQEGVLPALREYNLAQFMAVDVPEQSIK